MQELSTLAVLLTAFGASHCAWKKRHQRPLLALGDAIGVTAIGESAALTSYVGNDKGERREGCEAKCHGEPTWERFHATCGLTFELTCGRQTA